MQKNQRKTSPLPPAGEGLGVRVASQPIERPQIRPPAEPQRPLTRPLRGHPLPQAGEGSQQPPCSKPYLLLLLLLLNLTVFVSPAFAQRGKAKVDPAANAEADTAASAEELIKQYGRLGEYQRYYRHGSTVFDNAVRFAEMDESRISPADRFLRAYYEGRWDEVRTTLEMLPDELADAIYDRMLEDLTGRNVPILTLEDFLGLADACPHEMTSPRIEKLGLLLRITVPKEQELWLRRAVEKGTRRLGGERAKRPASEQATAGDRRLLTGRILMHADFDELARQYLPDAAAAGRIEDTAVRDEILTFLATQEEIDQLQQSQFAELWREHEGVLANPQADSGRRQAAGEALVDLIEQAPLAAVEPSLRALVRDDPQAALRLASSLGKRTKSRRNASEVAMSVNDLRAQKYLLSCVSQQADLAAAPWSQVVTAMADRWIHEAEHTIANAPSYRTVDRPQPYVASEDLLESAPDGPWAEALSASLRERIEVCLSKVVLVCDHLDHATELIVRVASQNRDAGALLAEEYVKAWAYRHDPAIPEGIRKQYKLPDDAKIMVTPIMMEKNVADLARMMDTFRAHEVRPRNVQLLVDAFDVCYSNAEVYRRSHIEKVFGPVGRMDDEVFFRMIRKMTAGLSSRWRLMDVQEESGTRRSQQETLAMIRDGYASAIEMIDERTTTSPGDWQARMLAGSLLSDWGDFEYYQQLAAETGTDRVEAFRQKNNEAEEQFLRAAEVYAGQVAELGRGKASIDVYLAWFHALLGMGSGGQLNLAKPLDRAALEKIRDMIHRLPGDAAKAHVDKFARHVRARMEDTENPLHEQLKYKYLAGSLVITADSPFSFQASTKVAYYDQLLDELRLSTRVDGPNTIGRDDEFGIVLSIQHSEAIGRMADFGKYLVNETPLSARQPPQRQPVVTTYRMGQLQGRRDELEMNIREALSLFFDVRSIAFSPGDVEPRRTERPGWEETVLAYIHAKAKDSSVDKIPRIQINLEFLDMTGPVSIAAESAETLIKITDKKTPPRPFRQVDLTLTLDPRGLVGTEEVLLEIAATACGLVPDLEEMVDLEPTARQLPIARIDSHEGTVVREIASWADAVHPVSERRWTVALDACSLLEPPRRIELALPPAKVEDMAVKYQTYVDMDLVDLDGAAAMIGEGPAGPDRAAPAAAIAAIDPRVLYALVAVAVMAAVVLVLVLFRLFRSHKPRPLRARDVFHMPSQVDGFVVVQLLRSLGTSDLVRLSPRQRTEMQEEIDRVQKACFANGDGVSEDELRRIARRWLKIAC